KLVTHCGAFGGERVGGHRGPRVTWRIDGIVCPANRLIVTGPQLCFSWSPRFAFVANRANVPRQRLRRLPRQPRQRLRRLASQLTKCPPQCVRVEQVEHLARLVSLSRRVPRARLSWSFSPPNRVR